jgi:serine/threonine protein kinase/lipopolysaccharide biosynthesis regulator YciM
MGKKRIFSLDPDQLERLLSIGTEAEDSAKKQEQRRQDGDSPATSRKKPPPKKKEEIEKAGASISIIFEQPGDQIGPFKLLRILGEGGMGIAYLAEQKEPIKRQVALKVVKPGMDSKRVIARFEVERQALALLDHPNIAHIYDAGTTDSGRPYFAMEYVEGLPITEHCDHHKLTIEERLKLFLQICHAVHHAHQKGIIHRDIKPSNILVSYQDDQAVPKIIDFGVAKAINQPLTERTLFTEQGQLFGTPEYMSPEQADMVHEDIDTRSDIYSLGVLLYVLLTGALPFDSETLRKGGIEHIRQVIRETDPKTPSIRLSSLGEDAKKISESRRIEIAALTKCLHKELEWIPLKAMRKERAERYRSAAELADDVDNYLKGAPLIAGPPGKVYKLRKFIRRNQTMVTGVAAILAVLLAGIVVSILLAIRADRMRVEAESVSDFLRHTVLESLDPYKTEGRKITVRSILDAAAKDLEGRFQGTPMVEAEIRHTIGFAYWSLGLYEQHELHLGRAVDICRAQFGDEDIRTLAWVKELGWGYFHRSRFDEAEKLFSEAVEGMRRVLGEEHEYTPGALAALGCVYIIQGRFNEAEKLLLKAYEIVQRKLDKEPRWKEYRDSVNFIHFLGWGYTIEGRYNEAERWFNKGLEISRRKLGEQNWHALWLMHYYGELYLDMGRHKEAEDMLLETLARRSRSCGQEHPDTLQTMSILGQLYHRQGRYEEAESLLLETLEIARTSAGDEYICTLGTMYRLAELYLSLERYDEAEPLLLKASDVLCRILGQENWMTLKVRSTLARLYTAQSRYEEADNMFQQTLTARRRVWDANHPEIYETMNDLGALYRIQDRYDDAKDLLNKALEGRSRKLGEEHPETLRSMNDLAVLYKEQGDYNKAEPFLREALNGRRLKLGDTHPHTLQSWNNLIDLYEIWGKPEKADQWRTKLPKTDAVDE